MEGKVGLQFENSSPESAFGNQKPVSKSFCKSVTKVSAGVNSQIPKCPKGCNGKVWRDGHYTPMFGERIQRWSCCECGYKFSDPSGIERAREALKQIETIESKALKSQTNKDTISQICVLETKNLVAEQTPVLVVPQKHELEDQKGAIVKFLFWMQQNGKAKTTFNPYTYNLQFLVKNGANLFDPKSVNDILYRGALADKKGGRKYNLRKCYIAFMHAYGIEGKIDKPKINRPLPYLPPENHLDALIANAGYSMAPLLQTLKETAARPIEALRIQWADIDFLQNKISINYPAKNCNTRTISVSQKLTDMLKNLSRDRQTVFPYKDPESASKTFRVMRQRAIHKLGIPELRKIHEYTFRYWRATVEYQEYGKEGPVMLLLGHKTNQQMYKYVQLAHVYFVGSPKYVSKWITSDEEELKAVNDGWLLVREDKENRRCLYKKQVSSAATIGHD